MPPKTPKPANARERNESILVDRVQSGAVSVASKQSTLKNLTQQIRKLNRDNVKKDEEVRGLECRINDLIEKHAASLDMVGSEKVGVEAELSHAILTQQLEVEHLKKQVDNSERMEAENIELREEEQYLMNCVKDEEERHDGNVRDVKAEIIRQEAKLEKAFKKELVLMDAKYRQIAFDKLAARNKLALLENAKLNEEIVMQKIGLVNLKERMMVEDEELMHNFKTTTLYHEKERDCAIKVAKLRRKSYAYDARMADMDVTVAELSNDEELWQMKVDSHPTTLGDMNREVTRLISMQKLYEGHMMKWKGRFINIHSLVAKEKQRKLTANMTSRVMMNELPEMQPEDTLSDPGAWTRNMTSRLKANSEIDSGEFENTWNELIDVWAVEDGEDAVYFAGDSRPNTNSLTSRGGSRSHSRGAFGSRGGNCRGIQGMNESSIFSLCDKSSSNVQFGGLFAASMSVPDLHQDKTKKRNQKTLKEDKSAPNLQNILKKEEEGEGESPRTDFLPMLTSKSNRSILDEDREEMEAIAVERRRLAEIAEKERQIVAGEISLDGSEGGGEDGSVGERDGQETERTHDTVMDWIDNFKHSKRIDIAQSTGLTKARQMPLGVMGSLRNSTPGGTSSKSIGEAPRKRLAAALSEYRRSGSNTTFRKQMLNTLSAKNALRKQMEEAEVKGGKGIASLW